MATCELTGGINAQACRDATGGIVEFYIGNFANLSAVTETNSYVTTITLSAGTTLYQFKPNKNSSSWGQPILGDPISGTLGYEHTANLVMSKNEAADINKIKLVARASVVIIVKERSGRYYLLGQTEGMELAEGGFESGAAMTDANAWTLNFKGAEVNPAPEIDSAIIAALITNA